jgi:hypothetical protein
VSAPPSVDRDAIAARRSLRRAPRFACHCKPGSGSPVPAKPGIVGSRAARERRKQKPLRSVSSGGVRKSRTCRSRQLEPLP